MRDNVVYIKADEEITSVVDKLIKAPPGEVFLVIPKNSAIAQSLINFKLLKREADNLKKKVTIVTQDEALQRIVKRAELLIANYLPAPYLSEPEQSVNTDEEAVLKEQMPAGDFDDFLKEEKRPGPLSMVDIVQSGRSMTGKLTVNKPTDIPEKEVQIPIEISKAAKEVIEPPVKIYSHIQPESAPLAQGINKAAPGLDAYKKQAQVFYPETEKQAPLLKKTLVPSFSIKIFGIFVAAALIIAGLVFYFILPKAEITLTARQEKIVIDLQVLVDKNASQIDSGLNKIPGQLIKLEQDLNGEFLTTGERQLNEKSKGKIMIFNAYSSSPQTLVETTRLLSKEGSIYRLTKTIIIPGAKIEEGKIVPSTIEVEVEADQAGEDYNIGPSDFTIPGFKGSPKYTGFYGKSNKEISGGSTEKIKILTQNDLDKAKEELWDSLRLKVQQELIDQIPADYKYLEEAIDTQIGDFKTSVEIGEKAEKFTLTVKGIAKALIFSEQNILLLLNKNLADQLNNKKELLNETTFNYKEIETDFNKGQLNFRVQGEQKIVWKINQEEIKKKILGKTKEEVSQIFSQQPEIEKIQVSLWPFWIKKIPAQLDKIMITVD